MPFHVNYEFAGRKIQFRVKQRLHDMISSRDQPDEDFLEKLIPTSSLSMQHAIDQERSILHLIA